MIIDVYDRDMKMYCTVRYKATYFNGQVTFILSVELLSLFFLFSFALFHLQSSLPVTLLAHDIFLSKQ